MFVLALTFPAADHILAHVMISGSGVGFGV